MGRWFRRRNRKKFAVVTQSRSTLGVRDCGPGGVSPLAKACPSAGSLNRSIAGGYTRYISLGGPGVSRRSADVCPLANIPFGLQVFLRERATSEIVLRRCRVRKTRHSLQGWPQCSSLPRWGRFL